ncbi:hypothetical protein MLD52_02105 [Puniceicoccaceae bacterium K14]|nr:hypothetical protein [Puniceicoccaceae bacterium K14]
MGSVAKTKQELLIEYITQNSLTPSETEFGIFGTAYADIHFLFTPIDDVNCEVYLVHGFIENLGKMVSFKKRKRELLVKTIPLHILSMAIVPFYTFSFLYWILFLGLFGDLLIPYWERKKNH